MDKINDGGPAFPMQEPQSIHSYAMAAAAGIDDVDARDRAYIAARAAAVGGMTLRDYFAAKAVEGLSANSSLADRSIQWVADTAYAQADAMLTARGAK